MIFLEAIHVEATSQVMEGWVTKNQGNFATYHDSLSSVY